MARKLTISKFLGNKGSNDIIAYDRWKKKAKRNFRKEYGGIWTVMNSKIHGDSLEERIEAKNDLKKDIQRRAAYTLCNVVIDEFNEFNREITEIGKTPKIDNQFIYSNLDYAKAFFLKINDVEGIIDLIELTSRVFIHTRNWKYKRLLTELKNRYDKNVGMALYRI